MIRELVPPTVPKELMEQAAKSPKKLAQDLVCGDVFLFRDQLYVALACYTDERTTQTLITAIAQVDSASPIRNVTSLRLFRTFRVPVALHIPLVLKTLDNTRDEITNQMEKHLTSIRGF